MPKLDLKEDWKSCCSASPKRPALVELIGPYSEGGPAIAKLHRYAADNGYATAGKHHEIYFSDPRRIKLERLRILLRQPVKKARV